MKRNLKRILFLIIILLTIMYIPKSKNILIGNKIYSNPNSVGNHVVVGPVENGKFTVTIENPTNNIDGILVPVWTEAGGQDDTVWYDAKPLKDGSGSYQATVYLKDHNMETGNYIIHVYLVRNNNLVGGPVANDSQKVDQISNAEFLPPEYIDNDSKVKLTLSDSDYKYNKIRFAVWSVAGGQDDLLWYDVKDNTCIIPISNHRTFGLYTVHVYAYDNNGVGMIINKGSFEIKTPEVVSKSFIYHPENDNIDISIQFNTSQNITSVNVPVWSVSNGQDDIIWYSLKKGKDGVWSTQTNLSKHDYFVGNYNAHFYVSTSTGMYSLVDALTEKVTPNSKLEASVNSDQTGFTINYSDYKKLKNKGYSIKYAVWSVENGQDDALWYDAPNGKLSGSFSDHLNKKGFADSGEYVVHFYLCKNGILYFMDCTTFQAIEPKATYVESTQNGDTIEVYIKNVSNKVKSIDVPAWSAVGDQDDVVWYSATNLGGGTWKSVIKLKNHMYDDGDYSIHVYLNYSDRRLLIGSVCNVSINLGELTAVPNGDQTSVNITLKDSVYKNVRFAVWSVGGSGVNGQDDLIWYSAINSGNTSYYNVPVENHKTAGVYAVHAYSGSKVIADTTFEISSFDFNASISDKNVEDPNGTDVIYKVNVNGITASVTKKVEVSVWPINSASAKYTYTAKKEGDNYVASVNPSHHKYNNGLYHTEVTVVGGNGVRITKPVDENVDINLKIGAKYLGSSGGFTTIKVYNTSPSVGLVELPTWSLAYGQDDSYWYVGKKQSDGSYNVVVESFRHPPFDSNLKTEMTSNLYVDKKLVSLLTPLTYTITKDPLVIQERFKYSQKDPRWAFSYYGGTMAKTGCMPTSLAMVFSSVKNNYILPPEVASYLYYDTREYNYDGGQGTTGYAAFYAAAHYNVSYEGLGILGNDRYTKDAVETALDGGRVVIAAVRSGNIPFVKPGYTHAIVLYGFDNGFTNVVDPLAFAMSGRYRVKDIVAQQSNDRDDVQGNHVFHAFYY